MTAQVSRETFTGQLLDFVDIGGIVLTFQFLSERFPPSSFSVGAKPELQTFFMHEGRSSFWPRHILKMLEQDRMVEIRTYETIVVIFGSGLTTMFSIHQSKL